VGPGFTKINTLSVGYMIAILLKNIQLRMFSVSCIISKMYNCYSIFQSGIRISFTSCYAAFHNQVHFYIETIKNMLSIGSKFPKSWIQSFWLILRFWVRFKKRVLALEGPRRSTNFWYWFFGIRISLLNYTPTDYNWRYLCFSCHFLYLFILGKLET
jgi:hypothetical protein